MNMSEQKPEQKPTHNIRREMSDFSSIVCFRALVVGVEQTLGLRAAMVALKGAGRKRGHGLVESLGLKGAKPENAADAVAALDSALGPYGTRLCGVDKLELEDGVYRIYLRETICSADEPQGSTRELSFTFGAVHGALESIYDVKLRGKQVGSVLRGQDHDILEFIER